MLRVYFVGAIFMVSLSVFAAGEETMDEVVLDVDVVSIQEPGLAEVSKEALITDAIEKSHEVIEGEETGHFLKDWIEAVRFDKKLIDGYRWASTGSDTVVGEVVLDSVLLFGLSHSLETASGPIAVGIGISNHWPDWLIWALGIGGGVISVPGLDPLCYLVFGMYAAQPHFRKGINLTRMGIVKVAKGIGGVLGVSKILKDHFVRPDYKDWMLGKLDHLDEFRQYSDGRIEADYSYPTIDDPQIKIQVEVGGRRPYIKRILVDKDITYAHREQARKWLSSFGLNANNFISKVVLKPLSQGKEINKPYIESITSDGKWKTYEMLDSALSMGPLYKYETPFERQCRSLFTLSKRQWSAQELGVY